METISNVQKAREIANDNCTHICLADCSAESYFSSENDCYKAAMAMAEWKDKQLADYLQREWDRWSGACSTIVSAHCREVERFANEFGIKLKINNPYIE